MAEPARDPRAAASRADFWTGIVLAALGLFFAVQSWRMPRLEARGIDPLTVPGIVPGILGVALLGLGLILAFRGADDSRPRVALASIIGVGDERVRLIVALAINLIFAIGLVGHLPFWLAAFLYLVVFMAIFGLEPGRPGWLGRGAMILAVAAATTAGIVYLFETLFLVRLP
jgi:putative tricarboxylic transport membrane protein